MEDLKITLTEVAQIANEIRRINTNIDDSLQYVKKEMDSLGSFWISDGSEMIKQRFKHFSSKFAEQKEIIDAYAKYLDYVVSSYDSLESTIYNNASNLN